MVVTAVLLAGLVCLLIVGSAVGGPARPVGPRPSVGPPLTDVPRELSLPSDPAVAGSPR